MSDEYKPISCDQHSQYELWVMRGQAIKLVWHDESGVAHIEQVRPVDVRAETGVEYLYFQGAAEQLQRVRLDHIFSAAAVTPVAASQQAVV